ncbi:MAG: hypothetical protein ACRCUE_02510 [Bosea sp. (in: a-proteobacteria)]
MDSSDQATDEAGMASMAAALLEQGRQIHAATLVVMVGIIGLAIIGAATDRLNAPVALLGTGVLVAAAAELWLAIRTGFDAALFRAVACGQIDLRRLDAALLRFRLIPVEKSGRPIELRIKGGLRLLRLQGLCLLIALVLLVGAMAAIVVRNGGSSS